MNPLNAPDPDEEAIDLPPVEIIHAALIRAQLDRSRGLEPTGFAAVVEREFDIGLLTPVSTC